MSKNFLLLLWSSTELLQTAGLFPAVTSFSTQSPQDEIFNTLIINDKGKQSGAL